MKYQHLKIKQKKTRKKEFDITSYRCRCLTCSHARCQWGSALSWSGWTGRNSSRMIYPAPLGPTAAWRAPATSQPDCRHRGPGPCRLRNRGEADPPRSRRPGRGAMAARRFPADEDWSAELKQILKGLPLKYEYVIKLVTTLKYLAFIVNHYRYQKFHVVVYPRSFIIKHLTLTLHLKAWKQACDNFPKVNWNTVKTTSFHTWNQL